ncbi:MAG: hypothetical protein IKL37_03270 [Alphaproteobacteria bacterium]|nr:hypothetical protein [Alphaproteobacteria bacterium]
MIYNISQPLIDSAVQCWACPIFDKLFQLISKIVSSAYSTLTIVCVGVFVIIFALYTVNAVWSNLKSNSPDTWHTKSLQKVVINSLFALLLLMTGVTFPRIITTITAEPVAHMTLAYTQVLTQQNPTSVEEAVSYTPEDMPDDEIFRPQLRNAVIEIMQSTIVIFQDFISIGIKIIDAAFEWEAFTGLGKLLTHIILFFIGLTLTWSFAKLFFKYCFYFADFIVAMAFFAFLFPISLMLLPFKGADGVPAWLSNLGKNIGAKQVKSLINSIVAMGSVVLTYIIILNVLMRFLVPDLNGEGMILPEHMSQLFEEDLGEDSFYSLSLVNMVALLFVLSYLEKQIPKITQMILGAFNVQEENKLSEQVGDVAMKFTEGAFNTVKNVGKTVIGKNKKPETPTK